MEKINKILCFFGIHKWEYKQSCNGKTHSYRRVCSQCYKVVSNGRRKCGTACPIYTNSLLTIIKPHKLWFGNQTDFHNLTPAQKEEYNPYAN
jgi:hypothetical protein